MGRVHHTGAVYLNGDWLAEAAKLDDVLQNRCRTRRCGLRRWTTKHHHLGAVQGRRSESSNWWRSTSARRCSIRSKTGINYITVRGFTLRHAATPWAPPTAEQIGLIGTHWSKGWIIENNMVSHSICSRHRAGQIRRPVGQHIGRTRAEGYVKTIERAAADRLVQGERSATTSSATTPSPTASRRGSSAAWARSSARHRQHHPRYPRPPALFRRRDGRHQVPRGHRRGDQPQPHLSDLLAASGWTGWRRAPTLSRNLFHDNQG